MNKKKFVKVGAACLAAVMLTSFTVTSAFAVENGAATQTVVSEKQHTIRVDVLFKDGDNVVATLPSQIITAGVNNYSIFEEDLPEGYKLAKTGDFFVKDDQKEVEVPVEKINKNVVMNIRFMDGETFVSGGDYTLTEGTHKYSDLAEYVPEGYKLSVSGDFYASQDGKLDVAVEKIVKNVTMNIRFMDGETFVAGGDYTLTEGTHNYSDLAKYVPEGYKMTVSGDFYASQDGKLDVAVEKINKKVVMNIRFMDGDKFVAGGDYLLPAGVQNYSILANNVPDGYKMTASGDFMVVEGGKLDVPVEKINKEVVMNIRFMDGETFVAGGDYLLPAGVQNYSILAKYVPDGYVMTVSGDFTVVENGKLDVNVKKISNEVVMNIRFMDGETFVAGGDYLLPAGVQNYSILEKYVPEGYEMTVAGDFMVAEGAKLDVNVKKIQKNVVMNIRFMDGETFVAGGDYLLPEGVQNYNILNEYVPQGYEMTVSGDFTVAEGAKLDVPVKKIDNACIVNVRYMDGDEFVAGGDYFFTEGATVKFGDLELPEGYELDTDKNNAESGFVAREGAQIIVHIKKIPVGTIINVVFESIGGKNLGGGDFVVDKDGDGIANYNELILPEGYKLTETGDFFVEAEKSYKIVLEKIIPGTIINVVFVDEDGNNLGGGDYRVDMDDDGVANYNELPVDEFVGYELIVTGDFFVTEGEHYEIVLHKVVAEERTVEVTFTVNPEYGYFTEYEAGPVTFKNISENSTQQFEVPQVTAKEGYKFVGWKGQGADVIEWDAEAFSFGVPGLCYFPEGSNVGYASIEAVFEEIDPEDSSSSESESSESESSESEVSSSESSESTISSAVSSEEETDGPTTGDNTASTVAVASVLAVAAAAMFVVLKKKSAFQK